MSCCKDPKDVIEPLFNECAKYFETQDLEKVIAMYHPDAVMIHKGKSAVYGKEGLTKSIKELFEMSGKTEASTEDVTYTATKNCEWIVSEGKSVGKSEKMGSFKYTYTTIWKKCGDTWLIYSDMFEEEA